MAHLIEQFSSGFGEYGKHGYLCTARHFNLTSLLMLLLLPRVTMMKKKRILENLPWTVGFAAIHESTTDTIKGESKRTNLLANVCLFVNEALFCELSIPTRLQYTMVPFRIGRCQGLLPLIFHPSIQPTYMYGLAKN